MAFYPRFHIASLIAIVITIASENRNSVGSGESNCTALDMQDDNASNSGCMDTDDEPTMENDDDKDFLYRLIAGSGFGGTALLLLVLFCITSTLLCVILRRLRKLTGLVQPQELENASKENASEDYAHLTVVMTEDNFYISVGSGAGAIVIVVLVLFCITAILLCKILRRLRDLSRLIPPQEPENSDKKEAEYGSKQDLVNPNYLSSDVPPHVETSFTDTEASEAKTAKEIEAMYAVVSDEHRKKKKLAKLCIQQYDDINLLDNDEGEQKGDGSQLLASVTLEGDSTGYSRLQHAGPRMSQTRSRHVLTASGGTDQLRKHDRKPSTDATKDLSYSEVRPTNLELAIPTIITGGYSVIEQSKDTDVPPPLPQRVSMCVDTTHTVAGESEAPEVKSSATNAGGGANYSVVVKGEQTATNADLFAEQFLAEVCSKKDQKGGFGEQLYDSVK